MLTQQDEEHLKLLSIFHYVMAGLTVLGCALPILYFLIIGGIATGAGIQEQGAGEGVAVIGGIFLGIAVVLILIGVGFAFALFYAGRALAQQRSYTFCFILSVVQLFFFPLGTALGIFTIIVLSRPQVKAVMTSPTGLIA